MLENFDPNTIQDEAVRQVVLYLMNLVESQHAKIQEQAEELQRQRDEINRLKGEQGKPKIKANKSALDASSEKERREWLKKEQGLGTNTAWWLAERASAGPMGIAEEDTDSYLQAAEQYVIQRGRSDTGY